MLYWLFIDPGPLADAIPGAGVFRYITFRTAWGVITALVVAYLVFPWFIDWMKKRKINQIIRDDGPESHQLNKVGTPTMGGVCILLGISLSSLLWCRLDTPYPWMVLIVMLGYGAIGFVDDWKKVMHRDTAGLHGRYKLLLQTLIGGGVLAWAYGGGWLTADLALPFASPGRLPVTTPPLIGGLGGRKTRNPKKVDCGRCAAFAGVGNISHRKVHAVYHPPTTLWRGVIAAEPCRRPKP